MTPTTDHERPNLTDLLATVRAAMATADTSDTTIRHEALAQMGTALDGADAILEDVHDALEAQLEARIEHDAAADIAAEPEFRARGRIDLGRGPAPIIDVYANGMAIATIEGPGARMNTEGDDEWIVNAQGALSASFGTLESAKSAVRAHLAP